MMRKRLAAAAALVLLAAPALADTAAPTPPPSPRPNARGGMFPMQGGEAIYKGVCQGCHMPDAKGAIGAGMYPALASNPKLEEAGYPLGVIINGQKAMPPLGPYFNDTQIADVVNYIRTHFGNHYTDKVTAAEVKTMR
ncbi:MAG TPA: cytochrome c [Rhizomicrobium sp.]|nr:cytochrome c [Rhizomicrobium sp.]